jgi:hypothetical protein
MCSRATLRWAKKRGLSDVDEDDTRLDELFGYTLAIFGFYTQWVWDFGLPFPFNIVLFPFTLLEWYIRWSVTS